MRHGVAFVRRQPRELHVTLHCPCRHPEVSDPGQPAAVRYGCACLDQEPTGFDGFREGGLRRRLGGFMRRFDLGRQRDQPVAAVCHLCLRLA
jgi:hypothetical protein